MTRRLTSSSLAGTWRKLVAVGTPSDDSMFVAVRAAAPRRGEASASPAGGGGAGLGAGAGAGAGFAAGAAGAGAAVGAGFGAAGACVAASVPLVAGAPSPAKYERHSSGTDAGSER
jgi:hypothetical protein